MKRSLTIVALLALGACSEAPQSAGLGDGVGHLSRGNTNSAEAVYQKRLAGMNTAQPVRTQTVDQCGPTGNKQCLY